MSQVIRGNLKRLLAPRHLAFVGGSSMARALKRCADGGFAGPMWLVNPQHDSLDGIPCVRRIADLPCGPDAVFIATNRELTLACVAELAAIEWDRGNDFFQPTSFQISNVHGGTGASNVIPGNVVIDFNFRFCTESTAEGLQQRVKDVLDRHGLEYTLDWVVGGLPFLTTPGTLVDAVRAAILAETGITTALSTTGGTSDGRFIAKICPQVIELGPPNATIHKIDEHLRVADIEPLTQIYRGVLERLNAALLP